MLMDWCVQNRVSIECHKQARTVNKCFCWLQAHDVVSKLRLCRLSSPSSPKFGFQPIYCELNPQTKFSVQ